VFGVASMLILYAQKLVEQLGAVINPALMKSGSTGDLPGLRRTYLLYPRASYFIAIPLYIGFIVFGGSFIKLWVGPEFADSALVLSILSAAELASLAGGAGGSLLFGLGRLRFNLLCSTAEAVVNVALTLALVGLAGKGIIGAAIGTLAAAALFRGLAHPIYTTRALQLDYMRYIGPNGWRILLAGAFAYAMFTMAQAMLGPETWNIFALAVVVSGILFAIGGPLILFGPQESLRLMRAMPGMPQQRNA
jgi:O-antigen/teichoic acid export membrane protein